MALNPTYNVVNLADIPQDIIDLLLGVTDEAFRLWGAVLAGDANVAVRIELVESTSTGTAAATWGNGTNLGVFEGRNVLVGAPAYELQTGQNVSDSGHDIVIYISRDYLLNELFLDSTPQTRDDIPSDRTDGLSVMLHEIGHALGFTGYYGSSNEAAYATPYDLRRLTIEGDPHFLGPNVEAYFGGPLDLTFGNAAHYGNSNTFPGDSDDPRLGLMNGVVFYRGYAYTIGELDLAILADTGLGTILDDVLDVPLHDYLRGGEGNDQVFGGDIVNHLFGDEGDDYLSGAGGDDELFGGIGSDELAGGTGNDLIDGGDGFDMASYADADSGVSVTLAIQGAAQDTLGAGIDTLVSIEMLEGSAFDDVLGGSVSVDMILGGDGRDQIRGNGGSDLLEGGTGNDWIFGGTGWDTIRGGGWSDGLFGENGDDRLFGEFGNDRLHGGTGNDFLDGGSGNDILIGSWGVDEMTGGDGADTFVFERTSQSGRYFASADFITDFSQSEGDVIDLSAIDAIAGTAEDDAFTFIGSDRFTGTAGELRFFRSGGDTFLAADVDGDGSADMFIQLAGDLTMTAADFVL